ncbi:methylated-DNA--[protein]-cysteine S-methyltransferase [Kordiimonas aquimaris]|uniref:methylated-DNA--[protein]-cysteine S-methyltransferase n=1 Tax=Kordiimonas aquimaris TaxID=707591 RepID=UPI0021D3893C|nr:methylated-DNA--[protein]-cysteine S-methyltransferase [Kordiimonas aquimaris]
MQHPLVRTEIPSPIGPVALVLDGDTVVICEFADRASRVERQLSRFYGGREVITGSAPHEVAEAFKAYFDGDRDALDILKTNPVGTDYERTVWKALRTIPGGTTDSYGALAKRLNSSPRAVGRANGRNPVGLIHPCHRIIGADGSLTGYAGGLERKEWLLVHEGAIMDLKLQA